MRVLLLAVALAGSPPLQAQPKYVIERKDEQTVRATATYEISTPNLRATEWVLFAAVAPNCDGQRQVKTTLSPAGAVVREGGSGRSVLRARVPSGRYNADALTVSVTHDATLVRRTLRKLAPRERPPTVSALSAAEKAQFLATSRQIDFHDPAFKRWAEKLPDAADPTDFARRVFDLIRESATYEFKPEMRRRASEVCQRPKTDCGGMAAWFVAAMRSKGVPARMKVGRWATSADGRLKLDDTVYYQWHVTAEFFAADIGWVPVDVAKAVTTKDRDEAVASFGNEGGDFLTFHFDTDVKLNTIHFGTKEMPFLQHVPYWVTGEGSLAGLEVKQTWQVEKR